MAIFALLFLIQPINYKLSSNIVFILPHSKTERRGCQTKTTMQASLKWKIAQFAEIRWWKNYLKDQTVEEYLAYKKNYWNEFLEGIHKNFSLPEDATVLDAGCGPAGVFIVLDSKHQVTAVDPLLDQYEENLPHFTKAQYPNTTFVTSGLEAYQPQKTHDHVFCLNAINHVSDLDLAIDQLVSCVAPGGTLYMSIDAHNHGFLKWIFRALPFDILHPHQYDLQEYSDMLTKRGLNVTQQIRFDKHPIFDYYLLVATKK